MILRELFIKLGLSLDEAAFARGNLAAELLKVGLGKAVDAAIGLGRAFVDNAKAAVEYGDEVLATSQSLGVATSTLQEFRHAAELSNVSVGEMDVSLKFLSKSMVAAKAGSGEQAEAFRKLGVSAVDGNGRLRDSGDVMEDLAAKLSAMPDGAEKTAVALQFFGRAGQRLIPMLNEGRDGIAAMRQEAHELGLVMGDDAIKAADALGDDLVRLSAISKGLWREAIAPLLPAIRDLVRRFLEWRKANAELIKQNLQRFMGTAIVVILKLGKAFAFTVDVIGHGVDVLKNHWQPAIIATTALFAPLIVSLAAAGIAAAGAALGFIVAATPLIALVAAIAGVMALLDDVDTYKRAVAAGGTGRNTIFGRYKEMLSEWLKPQANEPWWLTAAKDLVGYLFKALGLAKDLKGMADREAGRVDRAGDTAKGAAAGAVGGFLVGGPLGAAGGAVLGGVLGNLESRRQEYAAGLVPSATAPGAGTVLARPTYNSFNITQLPGEDGESFAQRVGVIVEQKNAANNEAALASVPTGD